MRKLNKKEIDFIDNYLKNSGVEFIDIRVELVDHVASDLEKKLSENPERGFLTIFKLYMLQHKEDLVKTGRKIPWSLDKKLLAKIVKNLFDIKVVLISGLLWSFYEYFSEDNLIIVFLTAFFGIIVMYVFIPKLIYGTFKFSFISRFVLYTVLLNNVIFNFLEVFFRENEIFSMFSVLVLIWFNTAIFYTAFRSFRKYQKLQQVS